MSTTNSLIPGYKINDVEESIYRPHPQVEFVDSTISSCIRQFDVQVQCSTKLLLCVEEALELYRNVPKFPEGNSPPIVNTCNVHFKALESNHKQLKDRFSRLQGDQARSSRSLLIWIKKMHKELRHDLDIFSYSYDCYHKTYHECAVEGLVITSNEGWVTTTRPDGSRSAVCNHQN